MKLHLNISLAIVKGLEEILKKNRSLRVTLNILLKQNRKWGSRDRRFLGKSILEIIRWAFAIFILI